MLDTSTNKIFIAYCISISILRRAYNYLFTRQVLITRHVLLYCKFVRSIVTWWVGNYRMVLKMCLVIRSILAFIVISAIPLLDSAQSSCQCGAFFSSVQPILACPNIQRLPAVYATPLSTCLPNYLQMLTGWSYYGNRLSISIPESQMFHKLELPRIRRKQQP